MVLPIFSYPHYAAPAYGLFIILILAAVKDMWHSKNRQIVKRLIVLSIPVCLLTGIILIGASSAIKGRNADDTGRPRAEIEAALESSGGKHLIFVDPNSPDKKIYDMGNASMFVYNEADIDNAKIVWAHRLNPEDNAKLIKYFSERKTWLLKPDNDGK